jgi:Fic family protein
MILYEICGGSLSAEANENYQRLEAENAERQYDFIGSIVRAALATNRRFLSQTIIKALNFHAIACLHSCAGEYRPWPVRVGKYEPPEPFRLQDLMDDFVNSVNVDWKESDPIYLASFVLWRINWIHPFINGNGRTARAIAYVVLCLWAGAELPGDTALPQLLKQERGRYVDALKVADESFKLGSLDLSELYALVEELVNVQIASAPQKGT